MNDSEVYSLERGDLVELTIDSGETITGEVMENSTFETPTGTTKQTIIIKTTENLVYTIEEVERSGEVEEHPLTGDDIEGFVNKVEHLEPTEIA